MLAGRYGRRVSYPYPAPYPPPYQYRPVPRPLSTSTTGAKVLTFVGIAVLVVAVVLGVGGGVLIASGVHSISKTADEISSQVDAASVATVLPGQTQTVTLAAGTSYTLWVGSSGGTLSSSARPVVTDPSGVAVTVTADTYGGADWQADEMLSGWAFTSRGAGAYTITAAADGPSLELVPGVKVQTLVDGVTGVARAVGGGFMVFSGVVLGVIAAGLIIGGAVWWSSRSKNARRAAATGLPTV